ncbi:zinc finger CCCH domain-containing protein 18 [Cannabis sativa]|uniref:zinc finger CCCH domain-containing protein 18 n=1 Tax=Cannabis sativa TaxID=3483 RepID=UPI0029C9C375|nr:zinc finger CCCH domain-containing protein 18 [Cannabis sativa]
MANDEEERVLETQLELQLHEQRDSLAALKDALAFDPANPELLSVCEEVVQAIKDAEESLLHLKRARLLREVDSVLLTSCPTDNEAKVEPLDPTEVQPEPLEDNQCYKIGSKCRFRYTNGRWYNGLIVDLDGSSSSAKVSFLNPTSESMLMCNFFLQQRCRFGNNCRLSHGIDVPLSSLKKYIPTIWEQSAVGSSVWAVSDGSGGLWRGGELESWDDEHRVGKVVFRDDESSANLGDEAITLSEYANMSNEEESELSSEESDSSDYDEDSPRGIGFLDSSTSKSGIQKETVIFAKWENHTRGIASKMMANMGYREGMGLGVSGQGIVDPINVRALPAKQSLDHAVESREEEKSEKVKKRSRGGKRKRDKKFAALKRAAKEKEEMVPDVFTLINHQLSKHGEALNDSVKKQQNRDSAAEGKKVDRRALVAYDDEVKELRMKIEKLEEMANRNRKEKAVYEAAMRKLNETRKTLADTQAAHASASNAVTSKEKEKKWLKF